MLFIWYKSKKLSLPNKFKNRTDFRTIKTSQIKATFYKDERLCSKKQIDFLFRVGKSEMVHPVKLMFVESTSDQAFPAKAMFVVPKKNFRKAHDRNKLKRRMREAYRLIKHEFYGCEQMKNKKLLFAFLYVAKKPVDYTQIEQCMRQFKLKLQKVLA